ncbi:MAG: sugar transferase [Candidatus Promineifilaceae bacterium]|jgi:lipopolysaccharide/colanic/teichoic acid biosynthesis glycosyltransferase/glycosyltransferase involved in cell wall biosynthesis
MISVIIPAHNAAHCIGDCIKAVANQSVDGVLYEIIVVDDGSDDGTVSIAENAGANVLRQPRRWPAAARNLGLEHAKGDIVCFTDADCVPKPDWIEELLKPFSDDEIIGAKGTYATRQKSLTARFVQHEYEDKYDRLKKQSTIDFIDTHSAAYRKEILLANDGFDARFNYLEDQELSFRLSARGYKMLFQPNATVYHLHSSTLGQYVRKKARIGYWKAQVVRRFPDRGLNDSHTPQVMKLQMGLMALLFLLVILLPVFSWALYPLAALAAVFAITTAPFVRKSWRKDRVVAISAPLYLAARAAALGMGYAWGTVRPQAEVVGQESTIGGINYIAKRLLDITGSLVGLFFTALLGPFVAVAIKIDSPGPVIFKQTRIGQGGKPFTMLKFRSMKADAPGQLENLVDINGLSEPAFKLENDPRITDVGKFLRRWSLDELPQFWNVLVGDMSLIGPRPEEEQIVALYDDVQRRRLSVKPGISGPMQIDARGDLPLNRRLELEQAYIDNYSFWNDLKIIMLTFPALVRGEGAR